MASPTRLIAGGRPAAAASAAQIIRSETDSSRPPCSAGHPSPAHPPSNSSRCHALPRTTCSVSETSANTSDGPPPLTTRYGPACSASHARTSSRKAASAALSSTVSGQ